MLKTALDTLEWGIEGDIPWQQFVHHDGTDLMLRAGMPSEQEDMVVEAVDTKPFEMTLIGHGAENRVYKVGELAVKDFNPTDTFNKDGRMADLHLAVALTSMLGEGWQIFDTSWHVRGLQYYGALIDRPSNAVRWVMDFVDGATVLSKRTHPKLRTLPSTVSITESLKRELATLGLVTNLDGFPGNFIVPTNVLSGEQDTKDEIVRIDINHA